MPATRARRMFGSPQTSRGKSRSCPVFRAARLCISGRRATLTFWRIEMRWVRFDEGGHPLPGSFSVQQPGAGQWMADEEVPAVPVVPNVVTAAQGGIALIQAGLLSAVQAAVD